MRAFNQGQSWRRKESQNLRALTRKEEAPLEDAASHRNSMVPARLFFVAVSSSSLTSRASCSCFGSRRTWRTNWASSNKKLVLVLHASHVLAPGE